MIFLIFSPKNSAKKYGVLTQNKAKLCKISIITLVLEKNANFFGENWQKSLKIVIITSTLVKNCGYSTFGNNDDRKYFYAFNVYIM
jgi:hypothetical protein